MDNKILIINSLLLSRSLLANSIAVCNDDKELEKIFCYMNSIDDVLIDLEAKQTDINMYRIFIDLFACDMPIFMDNEKYLKYEKFYKRRW